jgi:gamma-glutamylcyclotransferase (GGCT)/AIG2-like uncharacterized protein YtfP
MTGPSYLFVYGTLMRSIRHPMHDELASRSEFAGAATFNGRLYLVSHYPGAVVSHEPADHVHGELYQLTNAAALKIIDDYEGCGARALPPFEFKRSALRVRHDSAYVTAWVYLYNRPLAKLPRIMSGRYEIHSTQ